MTTTAIAYCPKCGGRMWLVTNGEPEHYYCEECGYEYDA